jgi:uncharacterized membrane protein
VAYLRYHDRGVLYSVSAGLGIGDAGRVSVLVRATAAVAALIAFALIRALQTRAFVSLQLSQVRAAVAARGRAVIDDVYPLPCAVGCGVPSPFAPPAPVCRTVNWVGAPGVVHRLDRRRFVDAAIDADALVVFRVGVGDSLHEACPLAETYRGDVPDQVVRAAVIRGVDRSFDQDRCWQCGCSLTSGSAPCPRPSMTPRQAVDAVDATEGLLHGLAVRGLRVGDVVDETGVLRVRLVLPTWEDYVRTGVEDLLPVAAPVPMVLRRIQRLLADLLDMSRHRGVTRSPGSARKSTLGSSEQSHDARRNRNFHRTRSQR